MNGNEVRHLAYTAFGAAAENQSTGDDPKYTYTGKEQDSSGLYYYGARYYDPVLCRFITADTLYDAGPQGLNRYAYALNNPMIYRDPTGHKAVMDVTIMIEHHTQIRKYVDFLPDFLLDMVWPVTPEDVASGMADQLSGFATVLSGPGKKAAEETVEEGVKQGKKVVKEVLEESSDEVLAQGKKGVTEAIEQSGDEVVKGASKSKMFIDKHGDMPSPRPSGKQSHHGAMSAWMKKHYPGYNPNKAPAILMENHEKTFGVYNKWRTAMKQKLGGRSDWSKVSEAEMRSLSEVMFDSAEVPQHLRIQYWDEFEKMVNVLSKNE